MINFIHKLLNPHCEHCAQERREQLELARLERLEQREELKDNSVCPSCETLMRQLEIANHEKAQLLEKLLKEPEAPAATTAPPISTVRPRTVPWVVRRQMLEAEDRKKAELLRNAPKPNPVDSVNTSDVAELEKELDVVASEREAQGNV